VKKLLNLKSEKPRLVWVGSNPSYTWGLSVVTKELVNRLAEHYEIIVISPQREPAQSMKTDNFRVYCCNNPAGIIYWLQQAKPDLIVQYNPVQWLNQYVDAAAKANYVPPCSIVLYVTVELEPLLPFFADKIVEMQPEIVLTPSKWASSVFDKEGFDVDHVYHGVDQRIYRPMPHLRQDREEFVYGCIGRNDRRKGIERLIKAGSLLNHKENKVHLMCNSKEVLLGEDLGLVIDLYKASDMVDFYELTTLGIPLDTTFMGAVYNNFDAHVLPASGEAFGLPVLESLSCGIPNIVQDIPVMREIYKDSVIYVESDGYLVSSRGEMPMVNIESLAAEMEILRIDKERYEHYVQKGLELAKQYTWEDAAKKFNMILQKYL
jgi:glycosyltransferase involved in cell wall biosynthesis